MQKKIIVLSSGGVDSTTCLAKAVEECGHQNVLSVSFLYGQKHSKELECSRKIAEYYNVSHKEFDLTNLNIFSSNTCTLLQDSCEEIPHSSYAHQVEKGQKVSTYVPFRNGLFVSMMASYGLSLFPDDKIEIYLGIHSDDFTGSAYADCSPQFSYHLDKCVNEGTYGQVSVVCPFVDLSKKDIVAYGISHGVPYELTWSCYEGGNFPCGKCATCLDRQKAFESNGVEDPLCGGTRK